MEKNEIYQKLHSIDFNFDNEEDIRMLISNIELYPEFIYEIYSILYFIVEREKYFKSKGYGETRIFENVLSDKILTGCSMSTVTSTNWLQPEYLQVFFYQLFTS